MVAQNYYADEVFFQSSKTAAPNENILLQFFASYTGAILTFHLQLLHQTAIASSAITTCLIWLLLLLAHKNKRYLILSVYCGSFTGMSMFCYGGACTGSMVSIYCEAAAFSLAAAVCYVIIHLLSTHFPRAMLTGYGGRLGATAFLSSYLCSLALREGTGSVDVDQIITSPEISETCIPYAIIACGGSIIPYFLLRKKWHDIDVYTLTGLTAFLGLIGSFLFSIFFKELSLAPSALYTGLFVSMTKPNLCSARGLTVAGALSGIFMLYIIQIFNGIGGNLGLAAMLAVLCVTAFFYTATYLGGFLLRKPAFVFLVAGLVGGPWSTSHFHSVATPSSGGWKTEIVMTEGERLP